MSDPITYDNSRRIHLTAVVDWLGGLRVKYGTANGLFTSPQDGVSIIRVVSPVHRVLATVKDTLLRSGLVANNGAAIDRIKDVRTMPLPVAAIRPGIAVTDRHFSRVAHVFAKGVDTVTGKTLVQRGPACKKTPYNIRFWCFQQSTLDMIDEWMSSQFGTLGSQEDERMLTVQHPAPIGPKLQAFRLVGSMDESAAEYSGTEQDVLRVSYQFELHTLVYRGFEDLPILARTT